MKECPIKKYIHIARCYKCQKFDHIAKNYNKPQKYNNCDRSTCESLNENGAQCTATPWCGNCWIYNSYQLPENKVSTEHKADAKCCHSYKLVLRCRQLASFSHKDWKDLVDPSPVLLALTFNFSFLIEYPWTQPAF